MDVGLVCKWAPHYVTFDTLYIHTYPLNRGYQKTTTKLCIKNIYFWYSFNYTCLTEKKPFISGLFSLLHGGGTFDEFDYCLKFEAFLFIVVFFWYFRPLGFFCPSVSAGVQRGGGGALDYCFVWTYNNYSISIRTRIWMIGAECVLSTWYLNDS